MMMKLIFVFFSALLFCSCTGNKNSPDAASEKIAAIPSINYSITHFYPHDTTLFTEGLLIHNGELFESTGSPEDLPSTKSMIGIMNLETGKIEVKAEIDRSKYFGEGITFIGNKLYQLTYKNKMGFIYDAKSFKQTGTFNYTNNEGWSLTTDGSSLIMSDGTSNLTYLDTTNLKPFKTVAVTENGNPLDKINELEYINGFIYANVWLTNDIVKIDPKSGKVTGILNFDFMASQAKIKNPNSDVLNGIAYDSVNDKIFITGKLWSNIFQIDFPH